MIRVATIIIAAALAFHAAPPAVAAEESLVPVASGGAADPYASAVGRMVQAMVEYTRWPSPPNPVQLCVSGPVDHAGRLDGLRLSDGRAIARRGISASPLALAGCDVLYLGRLPAATARVLTDAARGKGVLTIAESDPDGRSQAMFVLQFRPGSLTFRLNIDAVSRSGLRVDPRVLRLAQGG